jgi:hypothetical protein
MMPIQHPMGMDISNKPISANISNLDLTMMSVVNLCNLLYYTVYNLITDFDDMQKHVAYEAVCVCVKNLQPTFSVSLTNKNKKRGREG